MSGKSSYSSPLGPREYGGSSLSSFNNFARPLGQFSPKQSSSPYSNSPHSSQEADFIPLGNSSPIKRNSQRGRGNWRGKQRNSFSPGNSGFNSSCSPYSYNGPQRFSFNRRSRGGGRNSSASYNDDISLYYSHSMVEDPWAVLERRNKSSSCEKNNKSSGVCVESVASDSDDECNTLGNENSSSSGEGSS